VPTTYYSLSTERMRVSCIVFEIQPVICQKPQIFLPNLYLAPLLGWPHWNFTKIFGNKKLQSWAIAWCLLVIHLAIFDRTPNCDRHTHTHTLTDTGHSI